MRKGWLALAAIVMAGAPALQSQTVTSVEPAIVFAGGPIITMANDDPEMVAALAVQGGRIVATGTLIDVMARVGKGAKRIDLNGRALLPGFIDAHGHVSFVGQNAAMVQLQAPPVGSVDSMPKLQGALRSWLASHPEAPLIMGNGFDDSQLAEGRFPNRHDLDMVSATKPIILLHVSGHFAVLNSAALRMVGINADSANPTGGVIRRETDGKTPDGVLEEAAMASIFAALTPKSVDPAIQALVTGLNIYAANGITTAQDGAMMPQGWIVWAEAARRGVLPIDTVTLALATAEWPNDVQARIGTGYINRVRIAGLKFVVDGSPQGRTAWLRDPVPVPPKGKGTDYHGYPAIDLTKFESKLAEASRRGWQVFAHVNGDAAAQALIDGVRAHGLAGKRTIAIHNQVVRSEQLAEMKALDIQPSFFANHTYYWGDWHREVALGPKRAEFISPQASAWALGLRPSAHNDAPVTPPDIMRLVWSSVNRRTQSGDILGPQERISPYRALKQVTINAAWQIGEDQDKGSLEVGKRADLVILDANPLAVAPDQIYKIKIVATIKDGAPVFGEVQ